MSGELASLPIMERAGVCRLLARLLSAPPDEADLRMLAGLTEGGVERDANDEFRRSVADVAEAALHGDPERIADDFQRLFIGLGGGELTPYASYYLTGSLHDRPLVGLRQDMKRLGLARAPGVGEPEDHAATILEITAGLIDGRIVCTPALAADFIATHASSWLPRLFADLAAVEDAPFYARVGSLGSHFFGASAWTKVGSAATEPRAEW